MRSLLSFLVILLLASCVTHSATMIGQPTAATACRTDADCTIKNVGNCCGVDLQCVNVAYTPDPAKVKADCAREGRASICGSPDIGGCRCISGQCTAIVDDGASDQHHQ